MNTIFPTKEILNNTDLFWQYPVITEEIFYNQNKDDPHYIGFPWATCLDKRIHTNNILKIILQFIDKRKTYYTCCQHISFRKLIPLFKVLNIKIVYSPHKNINENIINDISILPCPLYAVNFEDKTKNLEFKNIDFLNNKRDYIYSFIGGYQPDYLTKIRNNIFNMKHPDNTYIINTGGWHFNTTVYSYKQNKNKELNIDNDHINKTKIYNECLLNSRYSLCPSGTGPNSIRFWESLACGSIPVLLSDTLELPYHKLWKDAIIKLPETDLQKLPELLSNISANKEKEMRKNCIEIYNNLKNNFKNDLINIKLENKKSLFTSYLCNSDNYIVQHILRKWKTLNPDYNILYFSDIDVNNFFKDTPYYEIYKKMKNGVAIADFFRICYINKYGGYWFDIDLEPMKVNIPNNGNIHLFDCGFNNISYMFIGGNSNQELFKNVIQNVITNIENNIPIKKQHIMEITGPRIIQNIICKKLNIINIDGCLKGEENSKIYLKDDKYEFIYSKINIQTTKTKEYELLQQEYKKQQYQHYNYI